MYSKLIIPCEVAVKLYIDRRRWVFFSDVSEYSLSDKKLTGIVSF